MIFYSLKELYLFTVTAQIFIWLSPLTGDHFSILSPEIAPGFFPLSFGTAKVKTFSAYPKYIFIYILFLFPRSFKTFLLPRLRAAKMRIINI